MSPRAGVPAGSVFFPKDTTMRITGALVTAAACGILIGSEATAFAWFLDLLLYGYLHIPQSLFTALGWGGVAVGAAVALWTGVVTYRAENRLSAEAATPAA